MAVEFVLPDFLSECDPEKIHERMMKNLPAGIDNTPGGFPYDFTMPTALEISELIQFHLVRTVMLMFPQFAWGEWLDMHGQQIGVIRKAEKKASGVVTVTGTPGIVIREGFAFCTESIHGGASLEYAATGEVTIPDNGAADVPVEALLPGDGSNVEPGAVNMAVVPLEGISSITNHEKIKGGTNEETDEAYYGRIADYNASIGASFVGNNADYIRWAKSVDQVGIVNVIPEKEGPGTVKLILMKDNGEPVDDDVIPKVYDEIMSPNNPLERKAPIGVKLTVSAPEKCNISYSVTVLLKEDYLMNTIVSDFSKRLTQYYPEAKKDGSLRYNRISAILTEISGVKDFSGLKINNGVKNIEIADDAYPCTFEINFIEEVQY